MVILCVRMVLWRVLLLLLLLVIGVVKTRDLETCSLAQEDIYRDLLSSAVEVRRLNTEETFRIGELVGVIRTLLAQCHFYRDAAAAEEDSSLYNA